MRSELQALQELAAAALSSAGSADVLAKAARIIQQVTRSAECLIVYAQDDEFLLARDGEAPALNDLSPKALSVIQRNLTRMDQPISFNLRGGRVEDFRHLKHGGDEQYAAFRIPATESSSEMCLLRGVWPSRAGSRMRRFMDTALPALALLLDRFLNAERSRRHQQQLEAMANAAQVLTRAEDMSAALTDIASSIANTTGFDYISIDVYDAQAERFTLRVLSQNRWASTSLARAWLNAFDPDRPDELGTAIVNTRRPLLSSDLQHDEQLSEGLRAFFKQALLASGAVIPMTFQDELLGTMAFVSYKPQTLSPEQVEVLESLASQMATALKAMRMYAELARSREETQRYARRIERQRSKLKRQAGKLRQMASTDALTGAYNYGRLHETLDRRLARAQEADLPLSVILADVDNFKLFNDTYGHLAGDEALRNIASVLKSSCRSSDVIGRYGGDEFMMILPGTDRRDASKVAQRILDELRRLEYRPASGTEMIPLHVAVGIAVFPEDGVTKDALIGHADAAMYDSKGSVEAIFAPRQHDNAQELAEYPISSFGLLDGLVRAVDRKDHYTKAHSEHDAEYAAVLGEALGLSMESLRALRIAGLLHDVGKIGIPDRILRKPGRLTKTERKMMQQHVLLTERIIGGVPHLEDVLAAASNHHEWFDGTGYPRGLKGEQIPLLGRLLAVADAFSAMTEERPYRRALSWAAAIRELRECAGTQFDPAIVEVFINRVLPQIRRQQAKAA